ncbi:MAG: FAD-dependent oxidoreductase [Ilumatobacteraceae bacterium]
MTRLTADVVVIGGGIAGVSAAYELVAAGLRVVLVEREQQLAHHTTGRSAAVFLESYGPAPVRALSTASRPRYGDAPDLLGTEPLLDPRAALWVAPEHQIPHLGAKLLADVETEPLDPAEALEM